MNLRLLHSILFFTLTFGLAGQDTLSFGGVYDLPGAEVRATPLPVSRLASQFTVEEVYRLPGTFYDPARLVALLPGVVQTNDQANHLSVRGNTPNANLWRLNGLAIVNPNHTANAGTFYDFPTSNGGGVNAISAQMLDNSAFYTYGLPLEYGNATGGTFDLRLRPGAKDFGRQQIQAGFIGFDGMAEGPIGLLGKTSYLVNARYSFTGLLADMGVDFGGESIRFADLNAHLHHEWEGGELSAFTVLGRSANVFAFTDEEGEGVTEQKELFDIDFSSGLAIAGVTAKHTLGGGRLEVVGKLGFSATDTERDQRFNDRRPGRLLLTQEEQLLTAQLKLAYNYGEFSRVEVGQEYLDRRFETDVDLRRGLRDNDASALALFAGYHVSKPRTDLSLGLRAVNYVGLDPTPQTNVDESFFRFEPRFFVSRRFREERISLSLEAVSRLPIAAMAMNHFGRGLNAPTTWQGNFRYSRQLFRATVAATAFYQHTPNENAIRRDFFWISMNNFLEFDPDYAITTTIPTRRYGLELEAAGGRRTKGWYYRGSLTVLNAETRQELGEWVKDRYSLDYIANLTLGREWPGRDKIDRERTYGINLALIAHGGELYGSIEATTTDDFNRFEPYFRTPVLTGGLINANGAYFRPDLRLYKTKVRTRTTTTLALDIQNVAGVENVANVYYDAFLERPNERLQLGLIPVLSYRITWR
ncbi:MAG: hypothetical protein AAF597_04210 [Bacteroidota bacterium]